MIMGYVFDKLKKRKVAKPYKIELADRGTPDTIFCIPTKITQDMVGSEIGVFVGIEVKKSAEEVKKWKRLEARVMEGESLPVSYERETAQIIQARKIRKAGGIHIVTHSLVDFIEQGIKYFPNFK